MIYKYTGNFHYLNEPAVAMTSRVTPLLTSSDVRIFANSGHFRNGNSQKGGPTKRPESVGGTAKKVWGAQVRDASYSLSMANGSHPAPGTKGKQKRAVHAGVFGGGSAFTKRVEATSRREIKRLEGNPYLYPNHNPEPKPKP